MSVRAYKYKKVTHAQLEKCIRWCQNVLNLRDWDIDLITGESSPEEEDGIVTQIEEVGQAFIKPEYLKASIWIPLERHKKEDYNPYQTCVHEMIHVLSCGVGNIPSKDSEIISYRLDSPLYILYCKENRIKPGLERDN